MFNDSLYKVIKETISLYVEDYNDETNILGITPVRNVIYILFELEKKLNIDINEELIEKVKHFSVNNIYDFVSKLDMVYELK